MKLFTKSIDKQLFEQYSKGSDLENQKVVAKIFNPYGRGVWYLLNSDPNDPDYLWAIVDLFEPEMGSVSREELETLRVPPFGLGLERDLYFDPKPAKEVWNALIIGQRFSRGGMVAGRWYKDNSGKEFRYIGESQGKLLFNDGTKIVEKDEDDFEEKPKERKLFGFFEEGGQAKSFDPQSIIGRRIDEGKVIKVEDYGNDIFWVTTESWSGLVTKRGFSKDELIKLTNGEKVEGLKMYANGGFVEKTDEELKGMNDDELFAYLDSKAAYMKQYSRPLPGTKAKKYAANATAIQFKNEGTSKLEANFPNISKIDEQATKDYQETLSKRLKNKMAKGGMIEHGLKIGDKITTDMFWDNQIVVENAKTHKRAQINLETGERKEEMAKGGETTNQWVIFTREDYLKKPIVVDEFFSTHATAKRKLRKLQAPNVKETYFMTDKATFEEMKDDKMAMGGKVKFTDKVKAIKASLLKRKKVSPKVQKDYGKTYSPKEAEESAKRIVGSMVKKEKMEKGGLVSDKPKFKKLMELEDRARASSYKAKNFSKWNETTGENFRKRWYKMVEKLRGWDGDGKPMGAKAKPEWIKFIEEQGIVEDYNFGDVIA